MIKLGQRFGRLVTSHPERSASGVRGWSCICDCGLTKWVSAGNLTNSKRPVRSCGCLRQEVARAKALAQTTAAAARYASGLKLCPGCKVVKPHSAFIKAKREPKGKQLLHSRCADCRKHQELMEAYGIGLPDFISMLDMQGGRCAICQQLPEPRPGFAHGLFVDHDHQTGRVRALLCPSCNFAVGLAKESVLIVRAAVAYLRRATQPSGLSETTC